MSRAVVMKSPVSFNDIAVQVKKAASAVSSATVAAAKEINRKKNEFLSKLSPEDRAMMRFGASADWLLQNVEARMENKEVPYLDMAESISPQAELPAPVEFGGLQDPLPPLPDISYDWQVKQPDLPDTRIPALPEPPKKEVPVPVQSPQLPSREVKTLEDLVEYAGLKVTEVKQLPEETETVRITVDDLITAAKLREPELVYVRR